MSSLFSRRLVIATAFGALVALGGLSACATTGGACPTGPVDSSIYDLNVLQGAFATEGATGEIAGNVLVARFTDVGVVALIMPQQDREFIRMSTVWGKDPNVVPTAEWLLKINVQNKDGIVKVYLDDDADVVTEWYMEGHPGLSPAGVAAAARVFAVRSRQVAGELSDYLN